MTLKPRLRKCVLTAHVTCTVGWLGAVLVFLVLGVLGVTSQNAQIVRGVYLVMEPAAWSVLTPLAFVSLLTGIIQSWGTPWGFFRHYWVVYKLLLTAAATTVLLIYMGTFRQMAMVAADPNSRIADVRNASPVLHSTLAILVLLVAIVLAIYKPLGTTPYGLRRLEQRALDARKPTPTITSPSLEGVGVGARWAGYVLIAIMAAILIFVAMHVMGGALSGH